MKSKWEKYFLINHKMILWTVIMILGGGLFGFMVGDWLMPETDGRWMPFGSFMAGMTYLLWRSFMGGILTLPGEYMHAVGMGETRKNFLKVYLGGRTIESLLMFLILLGMARIESIVCATWYPGMAGDAEVLGILRPQILLLILAVMQTFELIMGTMMLRFGTAGFSAYMLCLAFFSLTLSMLARRGWKLSLIEQSLGSDGMRGMIYVACWILCLILISLCVRCLRKVPVSL